VQKLQLKMDFSSSISVKMLKTACGTATAKASSAKTTEASSSKAASAKVSAPGSKASWNNDASHEAPSPVTPEH
jgi:hypothetical protein